MTINTRTPVLEEAENGASKIGLTFINLTDRDAELMAEPRQRPACVLSLDKTRLNSAASTAVVVSIPATCNASEGLAMDFTATVGSDQLASFKVIPEVKPAVEPKWNNLWAFAAAQGAVLLLLALLFWKGWEPAAGVKRRLRQPLYVDATWKFNDNWATNVTAIGAILTGVFGATTAKAFLGPSAESAVALATVGAAIALAFVAAGPVILLATKIYKVKVQKDGKMVSERVDSFTVGGLLLAASVIFASAFGQLWVVMATGEELALGGLEDWLWVPFSLAVFLLFVYGWRSLNDLLEHNTEKPEEEDADEIKAAKLIVAAIEGKPATGEEEAGVGGKNLAVREIEETIAAQSAAAGDPYKRRSRSALP